MSEIKPEQCRAARAFLGWKQDDLSAFTQLSAATIRAFENGGTMRLSNQRLLRIVFQNAGITFEDEEDGRMRITYDPAAKARFLANTAAS